VLDGGGWLSPHPCCLIPKKGTQYPLYRRLSGPQGKPRWVHKIMPPPAFNPWTIQPTVSTCTDCAILVILHFKKTQLHNFTLYSFHAKDKCKYIFASNKLHICLSNHFINFQSTQTIQQIIAFHYGYCKMFSGSNVNLMMTHVSRNTLQ
jgi:hypothetical protein